MAIDSIITNEAIDSGNQYSKQIFKEEHRIINSTLQYDFSNVCGLVDNEYSVMNIYLNENLDKFNNSKYQTAQNTQKYIKILTNTIINKFNIISEYIFFYI